MFRKALGLLQETDNIAGALDRAEAKRGDDDPIPGTKAYNDDMRLTFSEFADDGTAIRRVLHFFDPGPAPASKDDVKTAVRWADGQFEDHDEMDNILFVQHRDIAPGDFDTMTARLRSDLEALSWQYFGWEATIFSNGGG